MNVIENPGYKGVNLKGRYNDVPVEMQVSPNPVSNAGQILEHGLGYKVDTEAPYATALDRWVGETVAPKMVNWGEADDTYDYLNWLDTRTTGA